MGELIKKIGAISLAGRSLDVELNKPSSGGHYRDIHIQNENFRLEIPENEFLSMAACVLLAKRQFDVMKGSTDD